MVTGRAQKLFLLKNIFEFCLFIFKSRFLNGLQHFKNTHCSKGNHCSKVLINLLGIFFFFPLLKSGAVLLLLSVLWVLQQRWNYCFTFHNRLECLPQDQQIKYYDAFWEIFVIVKFSCLKNYQRVWRLWKKLELMWSHSALPSRVAHPAVLTMRYKFQKRPVFLLSSSPLKLVLL